MKKIKCDDSDIYKLQSHYHDFYGVHDKKGNRGTAFIFDKLTDDDVSSLKQWKNIIISEGVYKYAPEIKNYRVIVLDKCIK